MEECRRQWRGRVWIKQSGAEELSLGVAALAMMALAMMALAVVRAGGVLEGPSGGALQLQKRRCCFVSLQCC